MIIFLAAVTSRQQEAGYEAPTLTLFKRRRDAWAQADDIT